LLFAADWMSKPMLVTLPLFFCCWISEPLQRLPLHKPLSSRVFSPLLLEKIPFLALAIISSILTFLAQDKGHSGFKCLKGLPPGFESRTL